jgi:probable HAF family extracellular repeat protein
MAHNNHGPVVGTATLQISPELSEERAFRWKARTGMVALGTLGGRLQLGIRCERSGSIAGAAQLPNGDMRAVMEASAP